MTELIAEILRLSRRMRRDSGRGPSAAELAGYLHLPLAEVRDALARAKVLAAAALADGRRVGEVPGGLAEALTAEEERVLCRRFGIGDVEEGSTEERLRRETLAAVLASLTPREQRVLRLRFGIGKDADHTLEDARRQFGVTRDRVHRIQAKALAKLSRKKSEDS